MQVTARMNFQFTQPALFCAAAGGVGWAIWLAWKRDVQLGRFRRGLALTVRMIVLLLRCCRSRACNGCGRWKE